MTDFVKVATADEIQPGYGKTVEINGKEVAILNDNGTFYAIDNTCGHRGGPLGEGTCGSGTVTCPWHGFEYDLKTGKCNTDPSLALDIFEIKVKGNDILIKV